MGIYLYLMDFYISWSLHYNDTGFDMPKKKEMKEPWKFSKQQPLHDFYCLEFYSNFIPSVGGFFSEYVARRKIKSKSALMALFFLLQVTHTLLLVGTR